jgi:hypothetical protein
MMFLDRYGQKVPGADIEAWAIGCLGRYIPSDASASVSPNCGRNALGAHIHMTR